MFQFIKNAREELEHVVWPTQKETRKYMTYTVTVIIVLTIFLSILGYLYSLGLLSARGLVQQYYPSTASLGSGSTSSTGAATEADLNALLDKFGASGATQSGQHATVSGTLSTSSGTAIPISVTTTSTPNP